MKLHYIITLNFTGDDRGTVSGSLIGAEHMDEDEKFNRVWTEAVIAINKKHGKNFTKEESSVTFYRLVGDVIQ